MEFLTSGAHQKVTRKKFYKAAEHPWGLFSFLGLYYWGTGGDLYYRAMQQKSGDEIVAQHRSQGSAAAAHETDLGVPTHIAPLFDLCEAQLGPVDISVNNDTYCALETFDPELTTGAKSEVHLISATPIFR